MILASLEVQLWRVREAGGYMGLINCPDCGKQVSDRAAACIGCGAPLVEHALAAIGKDSVPLRASYDKKTGRFHGTTMQIVKLAVKAIQELKWKVDSANERMGLVTFQTGMTWGSWTGVVGSLHINEIENNFHEVCGSGKQNVSGAQLLAINLGNEAQKKVDKVISTMVSLASVYIDPDGAHPARSSG